MEADLLKQIMSALVAAVPYLGVPGLNLLVKSTQDLSKYDALYAC